MNILKRYWQLYKLNENVYNQEICAKNVNCQMLSWKGTSSAGF